MYVLLQNAVSELEVQHSRFLAEAFTVSSQDEARSLLKAQKEKYRDASHVVHAFVIGASGGILGCSDDGEPSGTAGRPVLDVLKGSLITNILVTVTRWFGGTLLGTGGLVRAYGDSVKTLLSHASVQELTEYKSFAVTIPYECHDRFVREESSSYFEITEKIYGTEVAISGRVVEERCADFCTWITELTSGRSRAAISEGNPTEQKA